MEVIKIMFFMLGSFFGVENGEIAANTTTVTINTEMKTITVFQEGLFSVIRSKEDSIRVYQQLASIAKDKNNWIPELKQFKTQSLEFSTSQDGILNAHIKLAYNNDKDLRNFAIDPRVEGGYSMINIPDWNLRTEDGKINGNYWNFTDRESFTFTLEPFKNIPQQYKAFKKPLIPTNEIEMTKN